MEMETKTLTSEVKAFDEKGEGSAVIATLNVIDHDGDVTLPGAFGEQVMQMVGAHNHQSVPIGKTVVTEKGDDVIADFKMNLDTDAGRNWHSALKFDADVLPPAKGEWSYGFHVIKSRMGEFKVGDVMREVRFLEELKLIEISPVLAGAGINTGTLGIKEEKPPGSIKLEDQLISAISEAEAVVERMMELKDLRADQGRVIKKDRLDDLGKLKDLLEEIDFLLKVDPENEKHQKALIEFQATKKRMLDLRKDLLQDS